MGDEPMGFSITLTFIAHYVTLTKTKSFDAASG